MSRGHSACTAVFHKQGSLLESTVATWKHLVPKSLTNHKSRVFFYIFFIQAWITDESHTATGARSLNVVLVRGLPPTEVYMPVQRGPMQRSSVVLLLLFFFVNDIGITYNKGGFIIYFDPFFKCMGKNNHLHLACTLYCHHILNLVKCSITFFDPLI